MGKNQNDCSIRVPCLRLLDESDWDNAEPESPDLDLWISLGCSRGHAKASRQRDDYGEETRMKEGCQCTASLSEKDSRAELWKYILGNEKLEIPLRHPLFMSN